MGLLRRFRPLGALWVAIWVGGLLTAGCSGGRRAGAEDGDLEADADGDGGGGEDAGPDGSEDADAEGLSPEDVPDCGDGVIDPGEECDDGNRLNGDGCDWLCRLGDGEPRPEPDPTVSDYAPSGPPLPADDTIESIRTRYRLPLTWSGSEFATAYPSIARNSLAFHRFDASGATLDSDWADPFESTWFNDHYCDLAWREPEYGLFCVVPLPSGEMPMYFMRLDPRGKPLSAPVVVLDGATHGAVDLTADGYVVAWSICDDLPNGGHVGLMLLDELGSSEGLPEPLVFPISYCEEVDVAAGPDGFGITFVDLEAVHFARVSADLAEVTTSGTLAPGFAGDIRWDGRGYVTAFDHFEGGRRGRGHLGYCVARFSGSGVLEAAPVCDPPPTSLWAGTRMAAGDGGLGLAFRAAWSGALFLRTDSRGVPVGPYHEVTRSRVDSMGLVWADDGFALVFTHELDPLLLQRLAEVER